MSRKVVHVAVNGVTGRMGYRQHLVRSLLSIRDQGGVPLDDGTVIYPEPVLVGRERAAAAGHRRAARPGALDDQPGRGPVRPGVSSLLRRAGHLGPGAEPGRRPSRPASTSTPRSPWPTRWTARCGWPPAARERGHHARRGAGQAVPAGHASSCGG